MTDEETKEEPTDAQLARFLVVYARQFPALQGLELNEFILEQQIKHIPQFRETALRHHRQFQEDLNELTKRVEKGGMLQCEYIRPNGKRCANKNEAGSFYCGLHKDEETK